MTDTRVASWFGPEFTKLHPLLQVLHREGGTLAGTVEVRFGSGIAGWLGRRLARKTGLPSEPGPMALEVTITHSAAALVWSRRFGSGEPVVSMFEPMGRWPDGFFRERTGTVELDLAVDTADQGWRWRTVRARYKGWRVPLWLLPKTDAFKRIENGRYRFAVTFTAPVLGLLLQYSGLLVSRPSGALFHANADAAPGPAINGGGHQSQCL